MFDTLRERYKTLTGKNNKKTLAQVFQNPDYIQDTQSRRNQILFYKLLMITAYADKSVDEKELDLIKDYVYEQCLTEKEWREIDYFSRVSPTREETEKIQDEIIEEFQSKQERTKILAALREIVEADDIISVEEKNILESFEQKLNRSHASFAGNILKALKSRQQVVKKDTTVSDNTRNPIVPVLEEWGPLPSDEISLVSAKLGLALVLIHADMEFHAKEKEAFIRLISEECRIELTQAERICEKIIEIPDTYFEISHLGRIITEKLTPDQRKAYLMKLFAIARADQQYDKYEDKYLRIISSTLLLTHTDFIAVKNAV